MIFPLFYSIHFLIKYAPAMIMMSEVIFGWVNVMLVNVLIDHKLILTTLIMGLQLLPHYMIIMCLLERLIFLVFWPQLTTWVMILVHRDS